jgi:hypothetical protein
VQGLCCPVSVNSTGSPATQAFVAAMQQFQAAGCTVACPDLLCPKAPSGICLSTSAGGTCE